MLARGFYKYANKPITFDNTTEKLFRLLVLTFLILGARNIGAAYVRKVKVLGAKVIQARHISYLTITRDAFVKICEGNLRK